MAWMRSGVRSPSAPLLEVPGVPGVFSGLERRARRSARSHTRADRRPIHERRPAVRSLRPLVADDSSRRACFGQHGYPNAVRLEHVDSRLHGSEGAAGSGRCASLPLPPPSPWRFQRPPSRLRVRCRTFPRTRAPRTNKPAPTRPRRRRRRRVARRPHRRPARAAAPAPGARLRPERPRRPRPTRALLLRLLRLLRPTRAGRRRPQTRASGAAMLRIRTRCRFSTTSGASASARYPGCARARARARRRTARDRRSCRAARAIIVSRRTTRPAARRRIRSAQPTRHASLI